MMTKEEYLKLAEKKWKELHELRKAENFYDYEKEFDRIWVELGKEVLERSISKSEKDRRKKRVETRYGRIAISKRHRFSSSLGTSRLSPFYRKLMIYVGQASVTNRLRNCLPSCCEPRPMIRRFSGRLRPWDNKQSS